MADVRLRNKNNGEKNAYIVHEWTRRRDSDACGVVLNLPDETAESMRTYPGFIPLETDAPKKPPDNPVKKDAPKEDPKAPETDAPKKPSLLRQIWDGGDDD